MSYRAKAKQLAWWPTCEKKLLTDHCLFWSGSDRARRFLTLYKKPLEKPQVKWWEDGWPNAVKPDSRDVNISFYQAFLYGWGLFFLCGGNGKKSRCNSRWSNGFTQMDPDGWLDVSACFIRWMKLPLRLFRLQKG